MMAEETHHPKASAVCTVCRGSRVCTFCNGDGYSVENERLTPCGVCETSGICQVCKTN